VWHFNNAVESFVQLKTDNEIFFQNNYNEKDKMLGEKYAETMRCGRKLKKNYTKLLQSTSKFWSEEVAFSIST